MSNLSPAAIALEADLCLLTRLPLPKEADLDAIKERVFGSVEGVPRTEEQSKRRYVDAIVHAFNSAGATSIDDFAHKVHRLHHDVVDAERRYEVAIQLRNDAQKLSAAFEKENAAFRRAQEDRLKEQGEALNGEHKDLVIVRRRLIDVESEGNHLRIENAKLRDAAHALTTERDRLAARVREHEETLAVLSNVNAELFKTQQEQSALSAKHDRLVEDYEGLKRVYHSICEELNDYREKCAALKKERDGLRAELKKAQEYYDALKTSHIEITTAHATFAKQVDGLTYQRDKAVTELEDMRERESIARADAVQCHQEMRALRTDLTTAQKHHADLTAEHIKLASDMVEKDRLMRDLNEALARANNRVQELQTETVEQENCYNHLALVVVDLLKGRGVE